MVCDKVGTTTEGRKRQVVLGVGGRHGRATLRDTGTADENENGDGIKELEVKSVEQRRKFHEDV